jgi:general secretion pathway protein E
MMVNREMNTDKIESYSFAKRHHVFLASLKSGHAQLICTSALQSATVAELQRYFEHPLEFTEVSEEEFLHQLSQLQNEKSNMTMQAIEDLGEALDLNQMIHNLPESTELLESDEAAPIIRLLNALLSEAIKRKASDIHFETFEEQVTVRFRIDGVLHIVLQPSRAIAPLIISRIKVMAKLDIAEKRLPQDGHMIVRIAGHAVDVRVSTLPASYGERVVLRLLDKRTEHLDLNKLGMPQSLLKIMERMIRHPHGMILVTGPTGSGKTTTLYAALTELNQPGRNILTVEDPVEYDLPGIGQMQVNPKVDMTFARGLRAILRQDPDIVMVGEIRDIETVKIAVQASLTGHLVLSTLHTNSAIGAITRLRDMGLDAYLIASTIVGVIAQRLVRLLCVNCKEGYTATPEECRLLGVNAEQAPMLFQQVGCPACEHTGFSGRTGIYELVLIDNEIRSLIHQDENEQAIEMQARQHYPSIREDGCARVLAGITTLEEVLRVTTLEDIGNGSI